MLKDLIQVHWELIKLQFKIWWLKIRGCETEAAFYEHLKHEIELNLYFMYQLEFRGW